MINAGGDIAVFGRPAPDQPWRIAIENPLSMDRILLTADLAGAGAVATSGSYQRGAHLVDPRSGDPTTALLSATVIGHDLAFADALATALYASGGDLLERLSLITGYHGFIVDGRGDHPRLQGLPDSPARRGGGVGLRPPGAADAPPHEAGRAPPGEPGRPLFFGLPARPRGGSPGLAQPGAGRGPPPPPAAPAQAAGRVSVTRVPTATSLSAVRSPPMPRSAQRAIASPSPEPPRARARAASPR